jgi:hypothetical protein
MATAPPPHNRMILPALRACGPFGIDHRRRQHNRGPLQRGIEPPLEAQRLNASGGWASHQALRAPDSGLSLDEPRPFESAPKHLQPFRGHAGDRPTAYRPGRLPKPQATEYGWNARDEQIAERDSQLRGTLPRFCSIAWFCPPIVTRHSRTLGRSSGQRPRCGTDLQSADRVGFPVPGDMRVQEQG